MHPGTKTLVHRHFKTEEIYHVTAGTGLMTLGTQQFPVDTGDTVLPPPRDTSLHRGSRGYSASYSVLLLAGLAVAMIPAS